MDVVGSSLINIVKHRYDAGDMVDQINYQFTPMLLLIAALNLMAKSYVGQPLQCWVPAQFTGSWESYAESHCYIENTYFVPWNDDLPDSYTKRKDKEIGYYQWVPFLLVLQAVLFYLPCFVWRILFWKQGINAKQILNGVGGNRKSVNVDDKHAEASKAATNFLEGMNSEIELGKRGGYYLTFSWIFVKFLYVLNCILQLVLINAYLGMGTSYAFWGLGVLVDVLNGKTWEESGFFPRVTMCDFQIRDKGNLHNWSVQCVLMINMFNEKIYIFIWWWFVVLSIASILSLIHWSLTLLLPANRREFMERYLRVNKCIEPTDDLFMQNHQERNIKRFLNDQLKSDGVLLVRLVQHNGGDLLTGSLIKELWQNCVPEKPVPHIEGSSLEEARAFAES